MSIEEDIAKSREFEMKAYLNSMKSMYDNAVQQNSEIYDIAFALTQGFSNISGEAVLTDSRVIKTFRYAIAPTISQMKFGQMFGLTSIDKFEKSRIAPSTAKHTSLARLSDQIAKFTFDNLDKSRFTWIADKQWKNELAFSYAKKWTCSIAADQNAQTAYRTWRKQLQEQAIIAKLVSCGYVKSKFGGIIEHDTDISIGEFTQEIRVRGRTIQKADVVFRSKTSKKLVLVEAKAVGVEIDAVKRIKECCDKANDWAASAKLNSPEIVAVIAGFFTGANISNIVASRIYVVWEHDLCSLESRT